MDSIDKSIKIKKLLNDVGADTFVSILYPALKENLNLDYEDIGKMYPRYKTYSENSQKSRLNKAKSILKNGLLRDVLEQISISTKLDYKIKTSASEYLKSLNV